MVWRELEPYQKLLTEKGDPRSVIKFGRSGKLDFSWLKKFVTVYLASLQGIQRIEERD